MKISTILVTGLAALALTAAPTALATPLPRLCLATEAEPSCQVLGRVDFQHVRPTVIVRPEGITP
ncbi:MAG: hypothetical protein ABWY93_32120 [Mycobacterium sp.]